MCTETGSGSRTLLSRDAQSASRRPGFGVRHHKKYSLASHPAPPLACTGIATASTDSPCFLPSLSPSCPQHNPCRRPAPKNKNAPNQSGRSIHLIFASYGCVASLAAPAELFTKSFNSLLGLKNGIFFAGTSTFSPVFGFLPMRPRRCRVRKLPKPRISILSPFCRASMMLSKIVSTIVSDSLRGSSVTRSTSSIRSAFVSVGCFVIVPCLFTRLQTIPHNYLERGDLEGLRLYGCPSSYH